MNIADSAVWMSPDLPVSARQPLYALWYVREVGIASPGTSAMETLPSCKRGFWCPNALLWLLCSTTQRERLKSPPFLVHVSLVMY